jgi:lipid-A-disaccharide synthase
LIITGEASGDLHGANLAKAIRAQDPSAELLGVGGAKMEAAGVRLIYGIGKWDVIGLFGLSQVPMILRTYRTLARYLRTTPLDVVVFIDNPGLNLRLARVAKRAGLKVVYYIAPQIWAWHGSRIRLIARVVDRVIVILPFESALYDRAGVPCRFVGHPLLDDVAPSYDRDDLRTRFEVGGEGPVVGLLPGSREKEIRAHLPVMLSAAALLAAQHRRARFLLAQAATIPSELIESLLDGAGVRVRVVRDQPSEVMAACDVLLVASGTATLQAALVGTPMVLTYRTSWASYWVARCVVTVPYIGLVNIVAGRGIVPELIQQEATPARLSAEAGRFLSDRVAREEMIEALRQVRMSLGGPGASRRAAETVLAECVA